MLVVIAAIALVAAGCVNFTGSKVITNGESSGPFVVQINCPGADPETEELTFNGEGTETTEDFDMELGASCTITEIETAGATSVTYECGAIVPDDLGVTCTASATGLQVEVPPFDVPEEVSVSFTVTNDFTAAPTTTVAPAPPTPASEEGAAIPVRGAPAFTG